MDFKALHTAIRNTVQQAGFRYLPASEWLNFELGIFPNSLANNSFTIRFPQDSDSNFEAAEILSVQVEVEFSLDALNDAYLEKLNTCIASIMNLADIENDEILASTVNPINTKIYAGDRVVVTFNQIQFDIRTTQNA